MGRVALFGFCMVVVLPSLLGQVPSWIDVSSPSIVPLEPYYDHVGLVGVDKRWSFVVLQKSRRLAHSERRYYYHADQCDVAIRTISPTGNDVWETVPSGLQYVFRASVIYDKTPAARLVVVGIKSNGRAAVMRSSLLSEAAADITFGPLIPEAPAGKVWLSASIAFGHLYVFEATSPSIHRYRDSNADGLPDQLDPVTPAPVDVVRRSGFFECQEFGATIRVGIGRSRFNQWYELEENAGSLTLITKTAPSAPVGPMPVLGRVYANQGFIRCVAPRSFLVQAFSGPDIDSLQTISGSYKAKNLRSHVDIPVSTLSPGHVVQLIAKLEGVSYKSRVITIAPPRFWVFPWEPYSARSGQKVVYRGAGFTKTMTVRVEADGGSEDLSCFVLSSSEVVVVMPTLMTRKRIRIQFTVAGKPSQYRNIFVRP